MNNRTYGIVLESGKELLDFNEILQTDATTLRKSIDGTQVVIKWAGATPSSLTGTASLITVDTRLSHDHDEILNIMSATVSVGDWKAWSDSDPL